MNRLSIAVTRDVSPPDKRRLAGFWTDPGDVSRRGAIWSHLRHTNMLVSQSYPPIMPGDGNSGNIYAYTAVSVTDEFLYTLMLPHVNSSCMQVFLNGVSSRHHEDRIVMILDCAGWHKAGVLVIPDNDCFRCRPMLRSLTLSSIYEMSYARRVLAILHLTALMPLMTILNHHFDKWRLTRKKCILLLAGHGL